MSSPGLSFAMNNPIIGAYVTGLQMRKQAEQQQFEREQQQNAAKTQQDQFKQQLALQQQHEDVYRKHLDAEHALEQAKLDQEKRQKELEMAQTFGQMYTSGQLHVGQSQQQQQGGTQQAPWGSIASAGAQPQQAVQPQQQAPATNMDQMGSMLASPQQNPLAQQQAPQQSPSMSFGGQNYSFSSPEEMLARQKALNDEAVRTAGAKAGAEAGAKLPSEQALREQEAKLQAANAQALETQRSKNEMDRTRAQNSSAQTVESMRANASRDVARISAFGGMNSDDFTNSLQGIANGTQKMPSGKLGMIAGQHLNASGQVPVDPKVVQNLNGIHALDTLRATMQDYIDNHAPDSRLGAVENAARALAPGDLKSFNDMVRGQASIAAKQLGQANRMSEPEIQRIVGSLPTPASGNTRQELLKKLGTFDSQYKSKTRNEILGGIPEEQKNGILARNGFNIDGSALGKGQQGAVNVPPDIHATVNFNGRMVPKYHTDTDGETLMFDPTKGGYVSIPKQ